MNIYIVDVFKCSWSIDPTTIDRVERRANGRIVYLCNGHSIVIDIHEYRYLLPKIKAREIRTCGN